MTTTHLSRRCALRLEARPSCLGQVRRIVSAHLRYWRLDPLLDPVLLGVTELLANVCRHAGPDKHCLVEMCFTDGLLTVSVTDHDPRPPRIAPSADPLATSGRGLAMIDALTDRWGTRPVTGGTGKVVWFTLCGAPRVPERAATAANSPAPADTPETATRLPAVQPA